MASKTPTYLPRQVYYEFVCVVCLTYEGKIIFSFG